MAQTCIVTGATGLIGTELLKQLTTDRDFYEVRVLSRHQPKVQNSKIHTTTVDFSIMDEVAEDVFSGVDTLFCCLGTTIKKAGSEEAFAKVDKYYVIELAKLAEKYNIRNFLVVSAIGASSSSKVFYNRIKGEMEEAVSKQNIPYIGIFRPSVLHGDRDEIRIGEQVAKLSMRLVNPFLMGGTSKYKSIYGRDVAAAMIAASKKEGSGVERFEYKELKDLIKK